MIEKGHTIIKAGFSTRIATTNPDSIARYREMYQGPD